MSIANMKYTKITYKIRLHNRKWDIEVQLYLLLFPLVENSSATLSKQVLGPKETIHRASQSNLENWNSE